MNAIEDKEQELYQLQIDMAEIRAQIDREKYKARDEDRKPDFVWMARAKHALRIKGAQHQQLQKEIGAAKKAERRAVNNTMERRFVDIARQRLDPEVFEEYWREATEMHT